VPRDAQPPRRAASSHPAVWVLEPRLGRADVPRVCAQFGTWIQDQVGGAVVCDAGAVVDPDAVTVDVLARLHLTAKRFGRRIQVEGARDRLTELLAVVGLEALLSAPAGLGVHPGRQPEQREQSLGLEERVDPHDSAR
jgi:ABC-type transporter Mla MlaB component